MKVVAFLALVAVNTHAAQVVSIADGDTLTILENNKQIKIRLANIDAPERKQAFGSRSRQSLVDMCFRKDAIYQTQTTDRYERVIAVVTCEGVEANRAQVNRGMAWIYERYNKDATLPALQEQAKAAKRGLWANADPVPPWEFRRK